MIADGVIATGSGDHADSFRLARYLYAEAAMALWSTAGWSPRGEMAMLMAFTLILVCQLAGEVLVLVTGLPIPGPVVGLLLRGGAGASWTPRQRDC
jgi:hypothetical protein